MRTRTLFLPFFLVLCLIATPVMAATLTVTTSAPSYAPGETIVVTGTAVANTDVTVQLFNPNGQLVDIVYVTSKPDGTYTVSFNTPSNMPVGQWIIGTYTVKAFMGTQTATATVSIQQRVAVTGKVVDSAGAGVAGATVTVGTAWTTTGSDGSFTVSLPAEGTYTLKVSKANFYTYTASVTASFGTNNVGTITLVSLEDKIAALEQEVAGLSDQVAALTSKVNALNSSLAAANTEIASLKTQVTQLAALTTTVQQLQATANSLKSSVDSLQATVAQLPAFYALAFIGIIIAVIAVILVYRKIAK